MYKLDFALNNLQGLIKQINQPTNIYLKLFNWVQMKEKC